LKITTKQSMLQHRLSVTKFQDSKYLKKQRRKEIRIPKSVYFVEYDNTETSTKKEFPLRIRLFTEENESHQEAKMLSLNGAKAVSTGIILLKDFMKNTIVE
jgi:hypothetical protein